MKRYVIILTLFIATIPVSAQWVSFGAKTGYTTTLSTEQQLQDIFSVRTNIANGFTLGLYARMGHNIYIQPELLYNFNAFRRRVGPKDTHLNEVSYKMSTFDIPVLAGYSIINTDLVKFRIMAGPRFSFNAGSSRPLKLDIINEEIRPTRVGLDCGLGIDVWRLNLDVRYNLHPDLYKYSVTSGKDTPTLKGRPLHAFQITLGYRIFGSNKKRCNPCN